MATTMNAIADAIQPSALEALLTQTLADEAGLNDVAEGFKPILAYVASLASNQCVAETFHMFEWEKTCKAYLTPILADEEKCAAVRLRSSPMPGPRRSRSRNRTTTSSTRSATRSRPPSLRPILTATT